MVTKKCLQSQDLNLTSIPIIWWGTKTVYSLTNTYFSNNLSQKVSHPGYGLA